MSYLPIYLDAGLSLSEKLSLSGTMLLRGMGTVFMVLVILWGCLSLFKVFASSDKKEVKKEKKVEPEIPAEPVVEDEPSEESSDDGAIIAAICAAVEAYRASEGKAGLPYRVVSFKRKNGRRSWSGGSDD